MLVTADNASGILAALDNARELVVDLETTGLNPYTGDTMVGVAVKIARERESFYFPFRHSHHLLDIFQRMILQSVYPGPLDTPNLNEQCRRDLVRVLSDQSRKYIGFNYGFDSKFLAFEGVPLQQNIEDVQVAAHLMNENEQRLALKELADKYLYKDGGGSKEKKGLDELLTYMGFAKNEMGKLPPEIVGAYACKDVELTDELREFYREPLSEWNLDRTYDHTCKYLHVVTSVEHHGMKLNVPLIRQYSDEAVAMQAQLLREIQELAGFPLNPGSSHQVCKWLGIDSSAFEILEDMMDKNPAIKKLVQFRSWQKVKSANYDKFLEKMDSYDRIHPNINITGTYTGRASSSNPNMQAIPVRDEIYKSKDVFVADDGHVLVEADFSQAEVRWATYYAQEQNMAEKLLRNGDIHTETSQEISIPRDAAKRLNFSVIYGIGAKTLSENLKISQSQAKIYLDKYHARYPGFRRMYNRCEQEATDRGYIRLYNGRYRHFNTPQAETQKASSNLIQGSVGAMVQDAMVNLHDAGFKMLLQVHDSVMFLIPESSFNRDVREIQRIMELTPWYAKDNASIQIPMKVDIKHGKSWGSMQKWKAV